MSSQSPRACGEPEDAPQGAEPVEQAENRTPRGTFAPGRSGNPQGRPASESKALRAKLATDGEADESLAERVKHDARMHLAAGAVPCFQSIAR